MPVSINSANNNRQVANAYMTWVYYDKIVLRSTLKYFKYFDVEVTSLYYGGIIIRHKTCESKVQDAVVCIMQVYYSAYTWKYYSLYEDIFCSARFALNRAACARALHTALLVQ